MAKQEAHKSSNSVEVHLNYTFEHINHMLVVQLAGEADLIGSANLRQSLVPELEGVNRVVFDLKGLRFADSHFLRLLLKLRKRLGGVSSVRVKNANKSVLRVFEITGLNRLFM